MQTSNENIRTALKLHSFIRSVENLLPFMRPCVNTPFYNMWLQAIRRKIIDDADNVLELYGIGLDWESIKEFLIMYYNDKRDNLTLTRELYSLYQTGTIEDFYGKIQHTLSLLINHANVSIQDLNIRADRIGMYRQNALNVFLAGLKEPIGGNIRSRGPDNLKHAFDACMEELNFQRINNSRKFELPSKPMQNYKFPKNYFTSNQAPKTGAYGC